MVTESIFPKFKSPSFKIKWESIFPIIEFRNLFKIANLSINRIKYKKRDLI
jgi:hypothetical protein